MSKHWNPNGWAQQRPRTRRRQGVSFGAGEIRLALLGGVFLGLVYAFAPSGIRQAAASGEAWSPLPVSVIDGDTFRYGGEKIRIADIDTPEVDGRCAYETELAARATDRLGELLHEGPFALEPVDRDEDRYGRKLRIVTRGGRSIGDVLVAEGLAREWTGRREPWC